MKAVHKVLRLRSQGLSMQAVQTPAPATQRGESWRLTSGLLVKRFELAHLKSAKKGKTCRERVITAAFIKENAVVKLCSEELEERSTLKRKRRLFEHLRRHPS